MRSWLGPQTWPSGSAEPQPAAGAARAGRLEGRAAGGAARFGGVQVDRGLGQLEGLVVELALPMLLEHLAGGAGVLARDREPQASSSRAAATFGRLEELGGELVLAQGALDLAQVAHVALRQDETIAQGLGEGGRPAALAGVALGHGLGG